MLEFQEDERPLGVQLFGAEPERLAEAARAVIDWVRPDFLDSQFRLSSVLIADDHVTVLEGLAAIIGRQPDTMVVADAIS